MSYYSHFEGSYQDEIDKINQRRQLVIDRAKQHESADLSDLAEQLAASDEGYAEHELDWVEIEDPRNNSQMLTVRPILGYNSGNETDPVEKDRYDAGLGTITIEGRLPSGEARIIGMMVIRYLKGEETLHPKLHVNMSDHHGIGASIGWESADAELWLRAAERAMDAQPV